jgi:pyrimidine-specific ribonucleoside hydrolase
MKRKKLLTAGIVLAVFVFLFIILVAGTPLWVRMGVKSFCIQGEWTHLKFVPCESAGNASPTVTPIALTDAYSGSPIPIIVDDDGSPDGVVALLYFLSNPEFDVKAATVSYGEAHPDIFAQHLQQLLASLGRPDIAVGTGRTIPLEGNNAFPESWRQASNEFWGISLSSNPIQNEPVPAAELMVKTINNSPVPVMLFISGSHTNLAEALRLDPGIAKNIRAVYIMGGSIYQPGNINSDWPAIDNSVAEWNIWVDPVAAREVFESGLPLHLVPLDATRQVVWTGSDLPGWAESSAPEAELAGKLLQWMLNSWSDKGVFIWDLVTAVQASTPLVCKEVALDVNIITESGPEQGQTAVTQGDPNVSVCLKPDGAQVKSIAASILKGD